MNRLAVLVSLVLPAAVVAVLAAPLVMAGAGDAGGTAALPTSQPGVAVPAAPGSGPSYVGGYVAPPQLPYVPAGGYPDTYLSPAGQCTTWAAFLWAGHAGRGVTWGGDAWAWLANAAAQGYATSAVPSLGAIAVWPRYYVAGDDATQWGHVAVVIAIDAGGYTVSEMNVLGAFRADTRHIALAGGQSGFIPLPQDALG